MGEELVQIFAPDFRGLNHKKHEIHYYTFQHCTPCLPPSTMTSSVTVSLPSVVSAACVDVYGTHSNVHLGCFHTGKITRRRRPVTPPPLKNLPAPPAVVIAIIRCPFTTLCPCLSDNCVPIAISISVSQMDVNHLYLLDFFFYPSF